MSIDLYPIDACKNPVGDFYLNLANGNFYHLADDLGIQAMQLDTMGHFSVKALRLALQTTPETRYSADQQNVKHIGFS